MKEPLTASGGSFLLNLAVHHLSFSFIRDPLRTKHPRRSSDARPDSSSPLRSPLRCPVGEASVCSHGGRRLLDAKSGKSENELDLSVSVILVVSLQQVSLASRYLVVRLSMALGPFLGAAAERQPLAKHADVLGGAGTSSSFRSLSFLSGATSAPGSVP